MSALPDLDILYRPVAAQVSLVRDQVNALWRDVFTLVYGMGADAPDAGGKLIRPGFCLLSAGAVGAPDLTRFVPMAVAMEMFHLAALAHDDVVDDADMRRGVTSLNALWDNHAAVLGGDYLVARGIGLLASLESTEVIANAVDCIRLMAEGELRDFGKNGRFTEEGCIGLARAKTASLFAVACSTPACMTDSPHRDDLHAFGLAIGTAFQLVDDLLDLTQDSKTMGKPSCGDLIRGKKTLPILYLRVRLDDEERKRLDGFRGSEMTTGDREWVSDSLDHTGARQQVENLARQYADEARRSIGSLPESDCKDAMLSLVRFVVEREA
jgi:geranylgeranyl pyrophosphate synthase